MKLWMFGLLLMGGLMLPAEELLSDFGKLRFDGKSSILEGNNVKAIFFCTPKNAMSYVKISTEKDALVLNLDKAFASGTRSLQMNVRVTDRKFFQAGENEQTLCVQGPKGSRLTLYFEGYTAEKKHRYQRSELELNGEKQIFSFKGGFAEPVTTLSLRYDFSADGIYKFYSIELRSCE